MMGLESGNAMNRKHLVNQWDRSRIRPKNLQLLAFRPCTDQRVHHPMKRGCEVKMRGLTHRPLNLNVGHFQQGDLR